MARRTTSKGSTRRRSKPRRKATSQGLGASPLTPTGMAMGKPFRPAKVPPTEIELTGKNVNHIIRDIGMSRQRLRHMEANIDEERVFLNNLLESHRNEVAKLKALALVPLPS